MNNWFDVDKEGLAKLLQGRGKAFIMYELLQNAWDTDAKHVEVHLQKVQGTPKARLVIHDNDPEGFKNFEHAWTLFAESTKKGDPTKRGLFNMGEKLVLSLCYTATISTTKGTVTFDEKGRHRSKKKKTSGSSFEALVRMNQEEFDECCKAVSLLLPPPGVTTYFNGAELKHRKVLAKLDYVLPTTKSDENGVVRPTKRWTHVHIVEPGPGEIPSIYEKGIPVVETGDKWHIDIQQRVPLNMNRDNVTPAYLRTIRTLVLNEMHKKVTKNEASEGWVREALADKDIKEGAFKGITKKRFGNKAVIFDPSDPEANLISTTKGYAVIGGRSMSRGEHQNNRRFQTVLPSGKVNPSPKPFTEGGRALKTIDESDWTVNVLFVANFAKEFAKTMLGISVEVVIADDQSWKFEACYGHKELTLNWRKIKKFHTKLKINSDLRELLIHEFAHEYSPTHLSKEFYDACCHVGSLMTQYALDNPKAFG